MHTLKREPYRRAAHRFMVGLMIVCLLNSQILWAVSGGTVIEGTPEIQTPVTNTAGGMDYNVNLNGGKSIIRWTDLNTGVNDNLNFTNGQAVLNRVAKFVDFQGDLNAEGIRVYILSPNGIRIGSESVITAAEFVASGLDMSNRNFLDGVDQFEPFQVGDGKTVVGQVQNDGTIQVSGKAALLGTRVLNKGTISSEGGLILMASGNRILLGEENSNIIVEFPASGDAFQIAPAENMANGHVANKGRLETPGGQIVLAAGDTFAQALSSVEGLSLTVEGTAGSAKQYGVMDASNPIDDDLSILMSAVEDVLIAVGSSATTEGTEGPGGDIVLQGNFVKIYENLGSGDDLFVQADNSINALGALTSQGDMILESTRGKTYLSQDATAGGDLSVTAGQSISLDGTLQSGGNLSLATGSDNSYSLGNLLAEGDIDLFTDLFLGGEGDQFIRSDSGTVTAEGSIQKVIPGQLFIEGEGVNESEVSVSLNEVSNYGNIYIRGTGDVQLSGDIDALGGENDYGWSEMGGVSVVSETGAIYTPGSDGVEIDIYGYSDEIFAEGPIGVDLPYGEGKAAIELISADTLTIGASANLAAYGEYYPLTEENPEVGVDNRPGINFLAEDAAIGGFDRDQGIPGDVAIYLASTEGNVEIRTPDIYVYPGEFSSEYSQEWLPTVVFDAYDSVFMPFLNGDFSPEGPYDYRLEVASRITEWRNQAISGGRLPYANDPDVMKELYADYVFRGAGLDNPAIDDGRAWVLEDLPVTDLPVAPLADLEVPRISGCPVELEAAAAELGIPADDLQLVIGNSLALNPNINPCETCSRLVNASRILRDEGGLRMAALSQVFNTIAPADAPFTPEVSASVMTAFVDLGDEDRQYALASEYIDAFVQYVAVVETQLKAPVGDAVALVLNKYGAPLMGAENPNISAYVLAQLQAGSETL